MRNIHYQIKPQSPTAHIFQIELTIQNPASQGQKLQLPAWIPGSYMIRDFAKNIVTIQAYSNNQTLILTKLDKSTWQCPPITGPLIVTYEVYAWDLSVRGAHLDTTHGFFNGTSVFLCPLGLENHVCSVEILPPEGKSYKNWRIATSLPKLTAQAHSFGLYQAANYEELIDHPVEMGIFTLGEFTAGGITHEVVISGKHRADMERICGDLKQICDYIIHFFGLPAPMPYYVFLIMALHKEGYGGLEHRSSCACQISRNDLPTSQLQTINDNYINCLNLCSHEYFHTWNIKRIKPEEFIPYDLTQEVYTKQLWVFEGFTAYYQDLVLIRSELINQEQYLKLLAQTCSRLWRLPGRTKQSLTDSSFDAWTKFYKQDDNAPNAIISYYSKGAVVALALDLMIRLATEHQYSLDDVMKRLWNDYGKKGVGVSEDRVPQLIEEIAGRSLTQFIEKVLYSTEDIELEKLLQEFGIEFSLRVPNSLTDFGGIKKAESETSKAALGVVGMATEAGLTIQQVFANSCAQESGIAPGDVLIAVDNLKLDSKNWETQIANYEIGQEVIIHGFRRDELMTFYVILNFLPIHICELKIKEDSTETMKKNRKMWLYQ